MIKYGKKAMYGVWLAAMVLAFGITAHAKESGTIKAGVYAESVELSGLTEIQAKAAVEGYIEELQSVEITLIAANNNEVTVTASDLGISWGNPELVTEAIKLGTQGNVIERYTTLKDLEHENKVLDVELQFDVHAINDVLTGKCAKYDQKAVNVSLKRENGQFQVVEGQTGYMLDVETSIDRIYDYLTGEWDGRPCRIALDVMVDEPKGSAEELSEVRDVLGTFTTSYSSSGPDRSANVINGCALINGTTLYPGEEFSAYDAVAPFTVANGYYMAGSYLNGKVVDSLGGGICQVSTTLYNAVLLAELEVTERHNHSMIVTYVEPSADAAIAESSGKDFRFVNNTGHPIYIEGYTNGSKQITFVIYGKETRDSGRSVRYESEVLEVIKPPSDTIYADGSHPIGYVVTESAHIGYKAKLWKIVTENGKEVSRTEVNSSSYKMVPRSATVGTATGDPAAYEQVMAAIGTGSIDHVKAVVAMLTAPPVESNDEE
ncbi:MAG: VanW family protein [Acetatifactor sp.]|nr:VanW family protein [Acetatifactor sp.]